MMDEVTPIKFFLSQNYPNPFSEKTVIKYCVAYKTRVQIAVYNTDGKEIEKLVDEEKSPGTYEVEFSTCHSRESWNLSQGYYFYRMTAGDFTSEKKWLCINKLSGRINMKNLIQSLFFLLLITQICFGQGSSFNLQSAGGIDSLIQSFMTTNHIPGLVACVVKDDKIGWEGYYGLANVALQDSVKQNTIFMLASVSKPFVGTALMQLWENGKFQLDDSINAYLPFPVRNPNFPASSITFKQLLSHVSSIRDTWAQMPEFLGDPPIELGEYLEEYLTPGGLYYSASNYSSTNPPASQYNYTNVGASLCAYLVEVISEIPFDEYCQDSIFVPLGMTNTSWFLSDLDTTLIARPYTWNGVYNDLGLRGFAYYPAAQMRTTIRSLSQFLSAHICYGKANNIRILDSATVRLMRTSHYPSIDPTQGLIWYSILLGQRLVWGHAGILDGVRAAIWLDETKRNGVIVLANLVPTTSIVPVLNALFAMADTVTVDVYEIDPRLESPSQFFLTQNYPNPFNPGTVISYQIPVGGDVTLKVFDLLGNEIATLVNEYKTAGRYEVEFKSHSGEVWNLTSGVYFYQLKAGSFIETKKMLLLK
jgi:CubicO group peptidase (beta-lactamase class C family)